MASRRYGVVVLGTMALVALLVSNGLAGPGCTKESCGRECCKEAMAVTLKSIDAKALRIVVVTGEGEEAKETSIRVCPAAKIMVDGKSTKLAVLKAGVAAKICQVKSKRKGDMVVVCIKVGKGSCSGKCGGCKG